MTGKQKRYERLPDDQHDLLVQLLRKEQHDPEILAEADRRDWRVTQKPFNIGTDGLPNELRNVVILYDKDYIRHEDLVDYLLSMTYNPLHATAAPPSGTSAHGVRNRLQTMNKNAVLSCRRQLSPNVAAAGFRETSRRRPSCRPLRPP